MTAGQTFLWWAACFGLGLAMAVIKGGRLGRLLSMGVGPLASLAGCCFCVSFWAAAAGSAAGISPSSSFVPGWPAAIVVDGLAAAAFSWVCFVATERLSFGLDL